VPGRIIDLTLPLQDGMPVYPGDVPVSIEPYHTIEEHGSNTSKLVLGSHAGTHLDAPWHFVADGPRLDGISLDVCVGPAAVLDFSEKGPGESIELSDLKRWERFMIEGSRVLLRTDWSRRFGEESYYVDWPVLSPEASAWLAGRSISLLGVETPSVDRRGTRGNHTALLGARVVLVEGLANLSEIKRAQIFFVALPLSLVGRDGSPVRAIGIEDETEIPDLKSLALEETLEEARPFSANLTLGSPPVGGIPLLKFTLRS